jgi:hypothetical protein
MTPPSEEAGDPLEPVLRDVEAELRRRLREACEAEAQGTASESVQEIRRLEDSLLAAAVAAEQSIALRRQIDRRKAGRAQRASDSGHGVRAAPPHDESTEPTVRVREFRDAKGQLWRAWPVTPGQARPGRAAPRYLGDFHKGWICFEALEQSARRRLPMQPARWAELPDSELVRLLDQAIAAPSRVGTNKGKDQQEAEREREGDNAHGGSRIH